jgi:hypothetical protein
MTHSIPHGSLEGRARTRDGAKPRLRQSVYQYSAKVPSQCAPA